jgi:hypothetical protein
MFFGGISTLKSFDLLMQVSHLGLNMATMLDYMPVQGLDKLTIIA